MNTNSKSSLLRGCNAVQIPDGKSILPPAGTEIETVEALAGTYKFVTPCGAPELMARTPTHSASLLPRPGTTS